MMADLLRWNPFDELRRFAETFDALTDRRGSRSAWVDSPYAAVSTVDDGYRVRIPLPGIAPENIALEVAGRSLRVRAIERESDTEVMRYEEVMTLPASVDAEKIGATFRHGLLELTLPYQEAVKPRRIAITTEKPKQLTEAA
jgi:HSP20 family protein